MSLATLLFSRQDRSADRRARTERSYRSGHAYVDVGAGAILIQMRKSSADEVLSFATAWENRLPVVIVPTAYYRTPVSAYRHAQISTFVWANHSTRAAATAMRPVCDAIAAQESVASIEAHIAPLTEIFELLRYDELAASEKRYLQPR